MIGCYQEHVFQEAIICGILDPNLMYFCWSYMYNWSQKVFSLYLFLDLPQFQIKQPTLEIHI